MLKLKMLKKPLVLCLLKEQLLEQKLNYHPLKTIVSLVDNGKDGISRALLNKGLEKNAWYQSQTQNGKNLFDYVAREYGTEFIGEGF